MPERGTRQQGGTLARGWELGEPYQRYAAVFSMLYAAWQAACLPLVAAGGGACPRLSLQESWSFITRPDGRWCLPLVPRDKAGNAQPLRLQQAGQVQIQVQLSQLVLVHHRSGLRTGTQAGPAWLPTGKARAVAPGRLPLPVLPPAPATAPPGLACAARTVPSYRSRSTMPPAACQR